ncbi:glycogen synthase [Leptospira ryugenii]|uniref:Glycogen synthase n=2 Tax=Leptospira ryugenii TaxID=1917863 RepID=A0A2P2E4B0_9LEPT|nr:glycogen synthase [Leptospira ryugenii]
MGGLSDMLSSLSKEQSNAKEISVALPLLEGLKENPKYTGHSIPIRPPMDLGAGNLSEILQKSCFREAKHGKVKIYFLDSPVFSKLRSIYANPEEHFRFAIFSYACFFLSLHLEVDLVHAHDWHSALVCALHKNASRGLPTVFTIHNLAYQGDHPLWMTGFLKEIPFELFPESYQHNGKVNYLKAALQTANQITTVSPGYRDETLTEPNGFGLSYMLNKRKLDYSGILNGIDREEWNPEIDPNLFANYNPENLSAGKQKNKESLYEWIGRPWIPKDRPLIGLIGRLTYQKGYATFLQAFKERTHLPFYFIFLGAGEESLENELFHLSHHQMDRIYFYKGYHEEFARRIEAASDFFMMPSLFEPCGLNQFYSQAYGSIPIVSRVGGLRDTVFESPLEHEFTGIVFEPGDVGSLGYALERSYTLYKDSPKLQRLQKKIMLIDSSWRQRITKYDAVYEKALQSKL